MMKTNENPYRAARKNAALYNDKFGSIEGAAEVLNLSVSSLNNYELNITRPPMENVVLMADQYNAPELRQWYCKHECPIGLFYPLATEQKGVEGITLRLLKEFDPCKIESLSRDLINITEDGVISEEEKPQMKKILESLDRLSEVISELKLAGEKAMR